MKPRTPPPLIHSHYNHSDMNADNTDRTFASIINLMRRYITLNIDYARLSAAEKVSILLSTVTFFMVGGLIAAFALMFLSFGIGHLLVKTIAPVWAFIYVAAFYVILFAVLVIWRRPLIVDPITRFITRLFVKPPKQ